MGGKEKGNRGERCAGVAGSLGPWDGMGKCWIARVGNVIDGAFEEEQNGNQ